MDNANDAGDASSYLVIIIEHHIFHVKKVLLPQSWSVDSSID